MGKRVIITMDNPDRLLITFPYNPLLVEKIKTIPGHRWHPAEKHWSFKNSDGTLEKILKAEEVAKILNSVDNLKHKAILMLVYSAGLRVGEVVKLKIEDIDSKRLLKY
jgi:integrase